MELWADKAFVLAAVQRDGFDLRWAVHHQSDREVVLAAVRKDGDALQFAAPHLRSDLEVCLEAVKQDGDALRSASDALRDNKDLVMEAVKNTGAALQYASDGMQADGDDVLEAVKTRGFVLGFASDALRRDREVILTALRQDARCAITFVRGVRHEDALDAAHCSLAAQGETAPVMTIGLIRVVWMELEITVYTMAGEVIELIVPKTATFSDLAELLVLHHGRCERVFIVLKGEGEGDDRPVSPWDCNSLIIDVLTVWRPAPTPAPTSAPTQGSTGSTGFASTNTGTKRRRTGAGADDTD